MKETHDKKNVLDKNENWICKQQIQFAVSDKSHVLVQALEAAKVSIFERQRELSKERHIDQAVKQPSNKTLWGRFSCCLGWTTAAYQRNGEI